MKSKSLFSRKNTFFLIFLGKKGFDISYKYLLRTICMKSQGLFSGKNKKKYFKMFAVFLLSLPSV